MDTEVLAASESTVPTGEETIGTVKWFSRMKGWGFIEPDGGERDVFVHYESIIGDGFRNLEKGERVQFLVEDSPKGPKAIRVTSIDAQMIH